MEPRSCDTMVALGSATATGQTIFGKNSDRPPDECQPLVLRPRRSHARGSIARCQFVELPEAAVTYRHVGSRPYWCWGYEHGFNEHQVVIGNEAVFSRFPESAEPKLIGMEIIRLGLERAQTATEAVRVMTGAVSRCGQGKFANDADVMTYDNSYIVADPRQAYVIETAGHEWAVKTVDRAAGISNLHSIATDWSGLSSSAEQLAVEQGWWGADWGRFDFGRAFAVPRDYAAREALRLLGDGTLERTSGDLLRVLSGRDGLEVTEEMVENVLSGRHDAPWRCARSNDLLSQYDGRITAKTMMAVLSDHGAGLAPGAPPDATLSTQKGTICYHRGPEGRGGNTAASLVADLCEDGSRLPVYWCSFYSPCLGLFLPVFIEGELPEVLSQGSDTPAADSPWWQFHQLSRAVYADPEVRGSQVQEHWAPMQEGLMTSAYQVAAEGRRLLDDGHGEQAGQLLSGYMAYNTGRMLSGVSELLERFSESAAAN